MKHKKPVLAGLLAGAVIGMGLLPQGQLPTAEAAPTTPDLGLNTLVFDPSMPTAEIQSKVDTIHKQMVDNEMGSERWALLFKPGVYGTPDKPLNIQVGYYTEVAGLGALPSDVVINGKVEVHNRCLTETNCIALDNFWRSASNLTVKVAGGDGCYASANFWAASQASPMRRIRVEGSQLSLMDYCSAGPQYASGGYLADSMAGNVVNGSQQQYFTRNSRVGSWSNGVWNQVFSGVVGAPKESFPEPPYTTLDKTPVSREKPFVYIDGKGEWQVWVPSVRKDSSDVSWADGQTPGKAVPLKSFRIVKPGDSAQSIAAAANSGKNLLFTPGIYQIDRTINIKQPNTLVLGLGLATLTSKDGAVVMKTADVPGIEIAGITFDAGPVNAPVLLQVGRRHGKPAVARPGSSPNNPTLLSDVFVRVGGPHVGKATTSIEVNSDNVLMDHLWIWRADHGKGIGWTQNTGDQGVVVNGNDVTATGFFVEHYQKHNVIWSGERGRVVFFQNELPYDPPNQAAYRNDEKPGWAAYKVADSVKDHKLWGGGVYIFTNLDPSIHVSSGFEVPVTPGVKLRNLVTVNLNKVGTIDHIVNETGSAATPATVGKPQNLRSFPVS